MLRSLRAQLSLSILLVVLITVGLTCLLANLFINQQFTRYLTEQESTRSENITYDLSRQYNALTRTWNVDYLHTVGMYSLYDGYIVKVYDLNGKVVWDAENHDMTLCGQIMDDITARMQKSKNDGGFVTHTYDLRQNGQKVGSASVSYYSPYFYSDSDFQYLEGLNTIFLVIGLLACASSLIIGWLLARRIARPITKTADIAKQISLGNYAIRFEGQTKTKELDVLAEAINHLAGALNEQETLRKRLSTDIAHELRTPLTAVASHLEAMLEGLWEATPARLQSCYEEIIRLCTLVADLERLAKIEGDNLTLNKSRIDLLEIARAVCENLKIELSKKNLSLAFEGESAYVDADRDRMRQVVTNLLSNAIKYTPANGNICIEVRDSAASAVVAVKDDGIGIPENELPLIFERFYRTDKSRNRQTGGAGIGLTIVKSIITAHGGTVTVDSHPDQGSCFTVTLPKRHC
jgi:two-component system sensor histidine kinase BaeS